jgi:hypothetical protein
MPAGTARRELRVAHDERWLSDIWDRQSFDRRHLRTTSGLGFKVVFRGLLTGEAGPDFRDAILALNDGSLLRGDVELHLESSGWRQHGHHRDPAYDRVLLHVVLDDDEPARNSRGEPVLTLELAGRLQPRRVAETRAAVAVPQLSYVVAPCQGALPRKPQDELAGLLRQLGLERFRAKQAAFEGELAILEPDQVLYAGLMEALGYSRNRKPFRELAALVPVEAVRCAPNAAGVEALLLEAAGFTPGSDGRGAGGPIGGSCPPAPPASDPATQQAHSTAQCSPGPGAAGRRPAPALEWQTVGVRPDNQPERRIAQFAAILERLLPRGLLEELLRLLVEGTPPARLRRVWRDQMAEVGPQRTDAMAINVVLPFAAAYGQATCQFGLSEAAEQAFLAFPREGANKITSYMRRGILGPLAGLAEGAAGQQALLQIWDRWCHQKVCALCPLGRR